MCQMKREISVKMYYISKVSSKKTDQILETMAISHASIKAYYNLNMWKKCKIISWLLRKTISLRL